ncbi:Hypothetical_protein [Hexamita inflata]|uniref:Hypothetical_protein n=1 Tax=Hexamita inflata TaxID=28002 RepID=A0AA86N6S9_9EUKA|nr:Hypothetical protein HINF_LOCUS1540 [Hexamita inflata]
MMMIHILLALAIHKSEILVKFQDQLINVSILYLTCTYTLQSITDKDAKVLKLAQLRLLLLRKIFKNLSSHQPDITTVDPLELQFYKLVVKGDHVEFDIKQQRNRVLYSYNLDEEEVKINRLLGLKIVPDTIRSIDEEQNFSLSNLISEERIL